GQPLGVVVPAQAAVQPAVGRVPAQPGERLLPQVQPHRRRQRPRPGARHLLLPPRPPHPLAPPRPRQHLPAPPPHIVPHLLDPPRPAPVSAASRSSTTSDATGCPTASRRSMTAQSPSRSRTRCSGACAEAG